VGSDPEELAATLRELARLDPVELGLQAVLERIVKAAATGCDSTGGVGLLLLGPDGQLGYVVAAGAPRRLLAGTQVRLAEGPSVDVFLQAASVSSSDLAAEPRWPNFRPLALAAGIGAWLSVPVHQRHGPIGALDFARTDPWAWRPAQRPGGRRRLRPAAHGDLAPGHRTAAGAALPGAAVRGPARHPDRAGAWRHHAVRTARPGRCGRAAPSTGPDRGANRSAPSPNASSPAPDPDRHPSAAQLSPDGRSQIPATRMFGQLVQTATLPEPCPQG
jgi:GAF domain